MKDNSYLFSGTAIVIITDGVPECDDDGSYDIISENPYDDPDFRSIWNDLVESEYFKSFEDGDYHLYFKGVVNCYTYCGESCDEYDEEYLLTYKSMNKYHQ